MHLDDPETGKLFGLRHRFKVCNGTCYLGGLIREDESKRDWLQDRTAKWEKRIHMIRKTAGKYLQESYAVVICAIQSEWIFLKLMMKNAGYVFAGTEKLLQEIFLPRLFFGKFTSLPPIVRSLSTKLFNKSGLVLQNPVTPSDERFLS